MNNINWTLDGLVTKPAINLIGLKADCLLDEGKNFQNILKLWITFNAQLSSINNRLNKDKWQKFGLYYGSTGKTFHYASCVPVADFEEIYAPFIKKTIPPLSYLHFTRTGLE